MTKSLTVSFALALAAASPNVAASYARDDLILTAPSCGPYHLYLCKTEAEKASNEALKKKLDAERDRREREREAARLQKEADIRNIMSSMGLGPGREAEAERLYQMRLDAGIAPPAVVAKASSPDRAPKTCANRRTTDEVVAIYGLKQPSRELAMASLSANQGVYDAQCVSHGDFGWQCNGKKKTGKTLDFCVGGAAQ